MTEVARFDGCEVVERLHSGPLSEVYRAVQRPLGRSVLIKAIGASILPSSPFAASLEREARLLAELDHPNIVKLHDFVRRDERMWMVLEHVDGWTLEELLKKIERPGPNGSKTAGRLDQGVAVSIALEVARALAHAHERGISHRDVRPRNIVIARSGNVKLTNFSVASDERMATAPELLDHGASYVGPSYMSPEQILGEPSDPRSDLFSLGVVLYEILSGERPFKAPDERNESLRIRGEAPPPLGRRVQELSPSVERIVAHCLEKMPSDRVQSASELLDTLQRAARELGVRESAETIREALANAGLLRGRGEGRPSLRSAPIIPRSQPLTLSRAVSGLVAALLLFGLGAVLIQLVSQRGEQRSGTQGGAARLELVPQTVAYLRVVVHPWAHVIVDGQFVDTTPFARPIPLSAGTHFVRFEHPSAPAERRTVKLVAGETLLLDVNMKLAPSADAGREPLDAGPPEDASP